MKQFLIGLLLVAPLLSFSQTNTITSENHAKQEADFLSYCEKYAITYIEVPSEKISTIKFNGELESMDSNASYLDYGIELKEQETQYYRLKNSNKILSVKSLYHLKLNYSKTTK